MSTTPQSLERIAALHPGGLRVDDVNHPTLGRVPGLVDGAGRALGIVDGAMARSANPYSQATGLVDHLTTAIVAGQVGQTETWVNDVFRPITPTDDAGRAVNGSAFKYMRFGAEHMAQKSVKLADGAPYGLVGLSWSTVPSQLEFYGVAAFAMQRALRDAPAALNLAVRTQTLPARVVSMALQADAASAMTNTSNYGANTATLSSGAEWTNSNGDPKANAQTAIDAILTNVGGLPSDIVCALPLDSFNALRNNAKFNEDRKYTIAPSADVNATLVLMANYLGVGACRLLNPRSYVNGAVSQLFGDDAFFYSMGANTSAFTSDYGNELWGVRFALNDGVAELPWSERLSRADFYAFNREWKLHVVNPLAGYLLRNTVA